MLTPAEMLALEETQPIPPRWRGVKRIALGVLAALVLLVLLRLGWGWEAQRRLDAKIAAIRAAGEPVLPEDFERPPIPSDQNAAVLYKEAIALQGTLALPRVAGPQGWRVTLNLAEFLDQRNLFTANPEARASCLAAYTDVIGLCTHARERPLCDWGLPPPSVETPPASSIRWEEPVRLVHILCNAAVCKHEDGDDSAALGRLRDAFALVRRVPTTNAGLTGYLLVRGGESVVARIEQICCTLAVAGGGAERHPRAQDVVREHCRVLVDALLDDAMLTEAWSSGWVGERAHLADVARTGFREVLPFPPGSSPTFSDELKRIILLPDWLSVTTVHLDALSRIRQAGKALVWSDARAGLPTFAEPTELEWQLCFPWCEHTKDILYYSYCFDDRGLTWHFCSLARRRMAAIALAIRLYEIDHGRRPQGLAALVPEYLAELPLDPFTSPPAPFHYVPDGHWPALYSVGQNGMDDGGVGPPRRGRRDWSQGDVPFSLNGRDGLRRTPPEP